MGYLGHRLSIFEVGHSTFQYVDFRIDVLGHSLEDEHVCQEGGELTLQLHVVVADDVQHPSQQHHSLQIIQALPVDDTEQVPEFVHVLLELPLQDLLPIETRQVVDHLGAFVGVAVQDRLQEINEVHSIAFVQSDHHPHID